MPSNYCDEKDPTNKRVIAFIRKYRYAAEEVAEKLDIPAAWLLGLAGTESGYGTSDISRKAHNFFGQNGNASGRTGRFTTRAGAVVARFSNFRSSAESFARDFGALVRGKGTPEAFINALVPRFNTADPKTNGNPKFREDTLAGIDAIRRRLACTQLKTAAHPCGAACKNFKQYGYCDRHTTQRRCWQHAALR